MTHQANGHEVQRANLAAVREEANVQSGQKLCFFAKRPPPARPPRFSALFTISTCALRPPSILLRSTDNIF